MAEARGLHVRSSPGRLEKGLVGFQAWPASCQHACFLRAASADVSSDWPAGGDEVCGVEAQDHFCPQEALRSFAGHVRDVVNLLFMFTRSFNPPL